MKRVHSRRDYLKMMAAGAGLTAAARGSSHRKGTRPNLRRCRRRSMNVE